MSTESRIWSGLVLLTLTGWCWGANIGVVVSHSPVSTDSVALAIDGKNVTSLPVQYVKPDQSGNAQFDVTIPNAPLIRLRAIGLRHNGTSIFPSIIAAIGIETDGRSGRTVNLDFTASKVVAEMEPIADASDGTAVIPVKWSAGKFFSPGDIVNIWAVPTGSTQPAGGIMFTAPLISSPTPDVYTAFFKVPTSLISNRFQVGYHALEFRQALEIPLFVEPGYFQPSRSASSETNGAEQQHDLGGGARLQLHDEEGLSRQSGTPETIERAPGVYRVVVGKDGRLVTVNTAIEDEPRPGGSAQVNDSKPPSKKIRAPRSAEGVPGTTREAGKQSSNVVPNK